MAKSLGNFITIKAFLKEHSPRLLRFLVLKNHYRSPLNYTKRAVLQAEKELERMDEFINKAKAQTLKQKTSAKNPKLSVFEQDFEKAMEDDFNTPRALAVIFQLIRSGKASKESLSFLKKTDNFFHFIFEKEAKAKPLKNVLALVRLRQKYREEGNWQGADKARKKVERLGWRIEDTLAGPKLKKIK
jgi:cysteinyl-tRNA synthetase